MSSAVVDLRSDDKSDGNTIQEVYRDKLVLDSVSLKPTVPDSYSETR
jgi:hypothetical protein